jgi:uncharacterized protein YbjQ (UPF0145 family)
LIVKTGAASDGRPSLFPVLQCDFYHKDNGGDAFSLYICIGNNYLNDKDMILTTTPNIEGRPIREYKGIVTSETIIGANFLKDITAGLRDFFGGRSGAYEKVLLEAKSTSLREIEDRARALGANAIVGIDIDYETIGETNTILMVAASGTAVVI